MKRIISLLLTLVMCLSFSVAAFAENPNVPGKENGAELIVPGEQPRAEETQWYYRITDDGLFQKRLWSITYGYWKTDWITIGHVDPNYP